ncbi:uncharacterized protein DS421_13g416040 [Arachis hypogaea]|nr:uncharacterized protein DS421_13g416040 [Arachis hypogaea]
MQMQKKKQMRKPKQTHSRISSLRCSASPTAARGRINGDGSAAWSPSKAR